MRQCAKVYFHSNGDTKWAEKSTVFCCSRPLMMLMSRKDIQIELFG